MNVSSLFQLLLKGCTIEASSEVSGGTDIEFQLLLKGCTIEATHQCVSECPAPVSVVVERMYD